MKITLLGNYGVTNIGDEAIHSGLVYGLKQAFPGVEIVTMGKGSLLPFGVRSFFKSLVDWRLWKGPLSHMRNADALIIGGGGLFSDEEGPFVSTFWLLHGITALLLKKPVYCLGISIGKMWFYNRWLLRYLLRKARLVMVRDRASKEKLDRLSIPSFLGSDFALLIRPNSDIPNKPSKPYVVMSLRPYKNMNHAVYKKLAQLCDLIIAKFGLHIKFLPLQKDMQNDADVMNKVFDLIEQKNNVEILPFEDDLDSVFQAVSNAELAIGMRLHLGIIASIIGTPFIPFVYMEKVNDFWAEFDLVSPVNIGELTVDQLLDKFTINWNNRRDKRSGVKKIGLELRKRAEQGMALLKQKLLKQV